MTTSITARHESITGISLTGNDGDNNRTYTLSFTGAQSALFIINVQGSQWQQGYDWTLLNDTITFINPVFNSFTIVMDYFTGTGSLSIMSGYGYCSTADIYRTSGISSNEISASDVSDAILEAETFACRYTKTVYWKITLDNQTASSSASLSLTKNGAGWTVNDYQNQYVYVYSGIGSGQIRLIESNSSDTLTIDRAWNTAPDSTSKFRIFYTPKDFSPYIDAVYDGSGLSYQFLPNYPLQLIETLSVAGTNVSISNIYYWSNTGKIQFHTTAEASIFSRTYPQQVDITYWYGVNNLPYDIKRLVELRASMMVLNQQMGGTFNSPGSVGLPEFNVSIGQAYLNISKTIDYLKNEYDELLTRVKVWPVFAQY